MPQSLKGLLQSRILERLTLWSCRGFSIIKKNNNQHSLTLGRSGFNVDATFPSEMRGPFFGGNLLITCRTKNKPMHSIAMSRMMESKTGNLNPKLGINWEFQKWPNASNARNFWCHGAPFFAVKERHRGHHPEWNCENQVWWRCNSGLCECCSKSQKIPTRYRMKTLMYPTGPYCANSLSECGLQFDKILAMNPTLIGWRIERGRPYRLSS